MVKILSQKYPLLSEFIGCHRHSDLGQALSNLVLDLHKTHIAEGMQQLGRIEDKESPI